jgi:putative tryptophan/tyrosine transport system substrate-binding protein
MQFDQLKRRDFISLLGAWTVWPLAARAQSVRRVGIIMGTAQDDPEAQLRVSTFREGLRRLGWIEDSNIRFDYRYTLGDPARISEFAKEIVSLRPDVIVANTSAVAAAVQRESRAIPIVFVVVPDPISIGLVESMARPGRNSTGFTNMEPSLGGKWVQILKEVAPGLQRVAQMYNPETLSGGKSVHSGTFEGGARALGIEPLTTLARNIEDIAEAISSLGREPNTGLVVVPDSFAFIHRGVIIAEAAKHKIPSIYFGRFMAAEGGLIAYGVDTVDLYRRAAPYVDRILRGERPADLPVQGPVKFELAINLKTARSLGLMVPDKLLVAADEVIE